MVRVEADVAELELVKRGSRSRSRNGTSVNANDDHARLTRVATNIICGDLPAMSRRSSGPPLVVRAIAMMFSTLLGVAELIVLILGVVLCVLLPLGPFV